MQIYQDFWSTILSVRLPFTAMQAMQSMSSHTRGFCAFARFEFAKHRFIPAYAGLLTASTSSVSSSVWFIPAYAGLLQCAGDTEKPSTVHPRIRGAFAAFRMKPFDHIRFIPAYAGLLRGSASCLPASRGSSPHTRGF